MKLLKTTNIIILIAFISCICKDFSYATQNNKTHTDSVAIVSGDDKRFKKIIKELKNSMDSNEILETLQIFKENPNLEPEIISFIKTEINELQNKDLQLQKEIEDPNITKIIIDYPGKKQYQIQINNMSKKEKLKELLIQINKNDIWKVKILLDSNFNLFTSKTHHGKFILECLLENKYDIDPAIIKLVFKKLNKQTAYILPLFAFITKIIRNFKNYIQNFLDYINNMNWFIRTICFTAVPYSVLFFIPISPIIFIAVTVFLSTIVIMFIPVFIILFYIFIFVSFKDKDITIYEDLTALAKHVGVGHISTFQETYSTDEEEEITNSSEEEDSETSSSDEEEEEDESTEEESDDETSSTEEEEEEEEIELEDITAFKKIYNVERLIKKIVKEPSKMSNLYRLKQEFKNVGKIFWFTEILIEYLKCYFTDIEVYSGQQIYLTYVLFSKDNRDNFFMNVSKVIDNFEKLNGYNSFLKLLLDITIVFDIKSELIKNYLLKKEKVSSPPEPYNPILNQNLPTTFTAYIVDFLYQSYVDIKIEDVPKLERSTVSLLKSVVEKKEANVEKFRFNLFENQQDQTFTDLVIIAPTNSIYKGPYNNDQKPKELFYTFGNKVFNKFPLYMHQQRNKVSEKLKQNNQEKQKNEEKTRKIRQKYKKMTQKKREEIKNIEDIISNFIKELSNTQNYYTLLQKIHDHILQLKTISNQSIKKIFKKFNRLNKLANDYYFFERKTEINKNTFEYADGSIFNLEQREILRGPAIFLPISSDTFTFNNLWYKVKALLYLNNSPIHNKLLIYIFNKTFKIEIIDTDYKFTGICDIKQIKHFGLAV